LYPNLRCVMEQRRVKVYDLARLIKVSHGQASLRLAGRVPFRHYERNRVAEHFGLSSDWLFQQLAIPEAAQLNARPGTCRECATLPRAAETRQEPIQDKGAATMHPEGISGSVTPQEYGATFALNFAQHEKLREMRARLDPQSKLLPQVDDLLARAERIQGELAVLFSECESLFKA